MADIQNTGGRAKLDVITAGEKFFSGEVESVLVKTVIGEESFYANHSPSLKLLAEKGKLEIRENGDAEVSLAETRGGFVSVKDNQITVFTDEASWAGA